MFPGDGGRRSRRGFAYQDAVTLLDCLDMHEGSFDEVGFEDLEDITCTLDGHATYRQVKTKEDGKRHSIATICAPEKKREPETSILGRLFLNKPLTPNTRFSLVLNETPTQDLGVFKLERGDLRDAVPEQSCRDIANRLKALALPNGVAIEWFITRFEVLVEPRTIDEVEAKILNRLDAPVTKLLGISPLHSELVDILVRLLAIVARDAMANRSKRWDAALFAAKLQEAITRSTGIRPDGGVEPLPSLAEKLNPVGLSLQEAQGQTEAMLRYRRRYRSAIGQEREYFDTLNDHVYAVCTQVSAERRSGNFVDPSAAYAATIRAVSEVQPMGVRTVPLPDKLAALSDVTARCQNRYSDDS